MRIEDDDGRALARGGRRSILLCLYFVSASDR